MKPNLYTIQHTVYPDYPNAYMIAYNAASD